MLHLGFLRRFAITKEAAPRPQQKTSVVEAAAPPRKNKTTTFNKSYAHWKEEKAKTSAAATPASSISSSSTTPEQHNAVHSLLSQRVRVHSHATAEEGSLGTVVSVNNMAKVYVVRLDYEIEKRIYARHNQLTLHDSTHPDPDILRHALAVERARRKSRFFYVERDASKAPHVDSWVVLQGMNDDELNGLHGRCVGVHKMARTCSVVLADGRTLHVRPSNLQNDDDGDRHHHNEVEEEHTVAEILSPVVEEVERIDEREETPARPLNIRRKSWSYFLEQDEDKAPFVGKWVVLQNMEDESLNGQEGRCVAVHKMARTCSVLLPDGRAVHARSSNLIEKEKPTESKVLLASAVVGNDASRRECHSSVDRPPAATDAVTYGSRQYEVLMKKKSSSSGGSLLLPKAEQPPPSVPPPPPTTTTTIRKSMTAPPPTISLLKQKGGSGTGASFWEGTFEQAVANGTASARSNKTNEQSTPPRSSAVTLTPTATNDPPPTISLLKQRGGSGTGASFWEGTFEQAVANGMASARSNKNSEQRTPPRSESFREATQSVPRNVASTKQRASFSSSLAARESSASTPRATTTATSSITKRPSEMASSLGNKSMTTPKTGSKNGAKAAQEATPPAPTTTLSVDFSVTLADKSVADFDSAAQSEFVKAAAGSLGVKASQLAITGVSAGSVVVKTQVQGLKDESAARAIGDKASSPTGGLAQGLKDAGLGSATVSQPIINVVEEAPETASPTKQPPAKSRAIVKGGAIDDVPSVPTTPTTPPPPLPPPKSGISDASKTKTFNKSYNHWKKERTSPGANAGSKSFSSEPPKDTSTAVTKFSSKSTSKSSSFPSSPSSKKMFSTTTSRASSPSAASSLFAPVLEPVATPTEKTPKKKRGSSISSFFTSSSAKKKEQRKEDEMKTQNSNKDLTTQNLTKELNELTLKSSSMNEMRGGQDSAFNRNRERTFTPDEFPPPAPVARKGSMRGSSAQCKTPDGDPPQLPLSPEAQKHEEARVAAKKRSAERLKKEQKEKVDAAQKEKDMKAAKKQVSELSNITYLNVYFMTSLRSILLGLLMTTSMKFLRRRLLRKPTRLLRRQQLKLRRTKRRKRSEMRRERRPMRKNSPQRKRRRQLRPSNRKIWTRRSKKRMNLQRRKWPE